MSEGRFREAQDEYLGILLYLSTPDDEVAMEVSFWRDGD